MSFSSQYTGGKQAIKRQRIALIQRIRRNFALKFISLLASILLYFYVQQERNPTIPRQFNVPIILEALPPDVTVDTDIQQVLVTVTGPQPVVDALKESDIRIVADLHSLPTDKVATERIKLRYEVKLNQEIQNLLSYEPWPLPHLEVRVHPQRTREMAVEAHYPKETRAGYHYGTPDIRPSHVRITGGIDRVNRVTQIVADASSIEPGGGIDNDFTLSARDADNNPVEGITIDVPRVHVTVPIKEDPYAKIVSISPIIFDQPAPGYRMTKIAVTPNQVRIAGPLELVDPISTLTTEEIPVQSLTETRTVTVNLILPSGVTARDSSGNVITKVTVKMIVEKVAAPPVAPTTP